MSKELFSARDYFEGEPLPIDHSALLEQADPSAAEVGVRGQRLLQSEAARAHRDTVGKIALARAEGIAMKLRRRRRQRKPGEGGVQHDASVVSRMVAARVARKKLERDGSVE